MAKLNLIERIKNADSDSRMKWGFFLLAGVCTFLSGIFDGRHKERLYRAELSREIKEQAKNHADEKAAA